MLALPLDLGLDPDERVRLEDTEEVAYSWGLPLHICAGSGKFAMADMLLARGADPNGQVCASGTPVGRAYGVRDWAMVKLLERHDGVVYAANAGYYRDAELARRLFADEAAGRLREGTVDNGTTLAETLLGTGATGGDPEIVRMALARIDWPRDDPRWVLEIAGPPCVSGTTCPPFRPQIRNSTAAPISHASGWCLNDATPTSATSDSARQRSTRWRRWAGTSRPRRS